MKDLIKEMLNHPFASLFIIGAIGAVAVDIIGAAKGAPIKPLVDISFTK